MTRAEISCLRFMSSEKMRLGVDFVVGATSVCGGFDLVEQVMGDVAASFPSLDRGGSTRAGAGDGHGAAGRGDTAGDESARRRGRAGFERVRRLRRVLSQVDVR